MANLDTRSKRASSVGLLTPPVLAPPEPDGALTQGDRQHIAWTYSGILATDAESTTIMWTIVPDRYDWRRYKVLRKAGETPPTDPNDATATEITVSGGSTRTTDSVTDPAGSGLWSYSIFAVYDEYGSGTDERYSVAQSITINLGGGEYPPTPTPTPTPGSPTPTPSPAPGATINWTIPPDRYDFRRYKVLRVSGATPTTDPEDPLATEVTVAGGSTRTTSSVTDDPGTGTWSYSLFVAYDEYGSGTDERFSAAATITVTQ